MDRVDVLGEHLVRLNMNGMAHAQGTELTAMYIIVMFAIAVACFVRSRRLENAKTINFAHLSTDDMKKRYRNGVEIKPSEIAKEKKEQKEAAAPAGINDSMADEDPQELDQEDNLLES